MKAIIFKTSRDGYSPRQCGHTLTIGELISHLEDLAAGDDTLPVFFDFDQGYTYGALSYEAIDEKRFAEDEEEEEDD